MKYYLLWLMVYLCMIEMNLSFLLRRIPLMTYNYNYHKWLHNHYCYMGIKKYECLYKISPENYEKYGFEELKQKAINGLW